MTCPSPDYCAQNGCTANGCLTPEERIAADRAQYRAYHRNGSLEPTWPVVPRSSPRPTWGALALGVACILAPFLAVCFVLAALWVLL